MPPRTDSIFFYGDPAVINTHITMTRATCHAIHAIHDYTQITHIFMRHTQIPHILMHHTLITHILMGHILAYSS